MQPTIARFFSIRWAAIGAGLFGVGTLLALLVAWYVVSEHRISIGVSLVSAFFLVLGAAIAITRSFPKGCAACKQPFTETGAAFSIGAYDVILRMLNAQDAAGLATLANAPPSEPSSKTTLLVDYCSGCRRIGQARVAEEVSKGDYFESKRTAGPIALSESSVAAAVHGIDERAARFRPPD